MLGKGHKLRMLALGIPLALAPLTLAAASSFSSDDDNGAIERGRRVRLEVRAMKGGVGGQIPNAEVRLFAQDRSWRSAWKPVPMGGDAVFNVRPGKYRIKGRADGYRTGWGCRFTLGPGKAGKTVRKPIYLRHE